MRPSSRSSLVAWRALAIAACGGALALPAGAAAQPPEPVAPLGVVIERPTPGVADVPSSVATLSAEVSDPTILDATLTIHGASYTVPVQGGRIEQVLVVAPGVNRVGVTVRRGDEVASDWVTWFVRGRRTELLVLATWEAQGEIIDLWVREPGGETCKWDHRATERGGQLLDFSTDAIGFGSQAFVAPEVEAGTYRLKVHYWGSSSDEDQRWHDDYAALLARLDAAERAVASAVGALRVLRVRERDRIAARLDRWALPAAPQTTVRIEAILFPGTRHERRWRFERRVERVGHLATLGEIEIDEAMIRAARAGDEEEQ